MGGGDKVLVFNTTRNIQTLLRQKRFRNMTMRIILHHKVSYVCF